MSGESSAATKQPLSSPRDATESLAAKDNREVKILKQLVTPSVARLLAATITTNREHLNPDATEPLDQSATKRFETAGFDQFRTICKAAGEISYENRKSDNDYGKWENSMRNWVNRHLQKTGGIDPERLKAFLALGLIKQGDTIGDYEITIKDYYDKYNFRREPDFIKFVTDLTGDLRVNGQIADTEAQNKRLDIAKELAANFGTTADGADAMARNIIQSLFVVRLSQETKQQHLAATVAANVTTRITNPEEKLYLNRLYTKLGTPASTQTQPEQDSVTPSGSSQETEDKNDTEPITYDDEALMNILLHPENGFLYSQLVGIAEKQNRTMWQPDHQRLAKEGMRKLFETEFESFADMLPGATIEEARQALQDSYGRNPALIPVFDAARKAGRSLFYQNLLSYNLLSKTGDFLHFGVNTRPPAGTPDALPALLRIYVTPKMWRIGDVASEVIHRAREKGYEPYGKVWDESTNTKNVRTRTDRLLFYTRTKEQSEIIMDALREVATEHPDYFEQNPPLLTKKTDIAGVGTADEPVQTGHRKESFTTSRETLLTDALQQTLDAIEGPKPAQNSTAVLSNGQIVDIRFLNLRTGIQNGKYKMEDVLTEFRKAIRQLAPKHNVDPHDFTKNLQYS